MESYFRYWGKMKNRAGFPPGFSLHPRVCGELVLTYQHYRFIPIGIGNVYNIIEEWMVVKIQFLKTNIILKYNPIDV
jgi:hypothetical protein